MKWIRNDKVEHSFPDEPAAHPSLKIRLRNSGKGKITQKERCAVGMSFPFELLDVYIGAWCATMVPHRRQDEFLIGNFNDAGDFAWDESIPDDARFTRAALRRDHYAGDVKALLEDVKRDLHIRGLGDPRI